jgi:16S rRNA processing protein RimM
VIARIDGVADRNAAEALKGRRLYAPREVLPAIEAADEFYAADLIGLAVADRAGKSFGTVVDVQDYGGGPILAIGGGGEGAFDLPFTDGFVPVVDLAAGAIVIELPEDFFAPVEAEAEPLGEGGAEGGD